MTPLQKVSVAALICLHLAAAGARFAAPHDPAEQYRSSALAPPSRAFLLGTDEFGRDQLSRILWGGQISLATGWISTALALVIGVIVGLVAGFWGRWLDILLMRGAELFLALPWLYLLLAVRAFLPLSFSPWRSALIIAAIIGTIGWPRPARLIRGIVLSAKEREYVQAARGFGASSYWLMTRHCLPEVLGVLLTQAAILLPQFILAEVTLSFLGLGAAEPAVSWGSLLAPLRQIAVIQAAWWMVLPVFTVVIVAWGFSAAEDALADRSRAKSSWDELL